MRLPLELRHKVRERVKKEFKLSSKYGDSLIRKANMRQRNSPIARPKSISPVLEGCSLARGRGGAVIQ